MNEKQADFPTVLCYCSTFLKAEMLHVYRQLIGLRNFEPHVLTRRVENLDCFPISHLTPLQKHPLRFAQRFYWKTLRKRRIPLSRFEVKQFHAAAEQMDAALIHVYLGTEAVRLIPYLKEETRPKIVSFHGVDTSDALAQRDFERLMECTDLFLARCESLKTALVERGCPEERIR